MDDKILIFLLPKKLLPKDLLSYEFEKYKKDLGCKIEIHIILDFLYPNLVNSFQNEIYHEDLYKFKSLREWKERVLTLKKEYGTKKIFIFNLTFIDNIESFKVSFFIKKNNFKSVNFSLNNIPNMPSDYLNLRDYFYSFLKFITSTKKISILFNYKFYSYLSYFLKISPDYHLVFGDTSSKKALQRKGIKIIYGNSEDFNLHLNTINQKPQLEIKGNYAIYLESPTPFYEGDTPIMGISKSERGTPESWFDSLDNYFSILEKKFNFKVYIAPHPKLRHKNKFPPQYKGREIISDPLSVVSRRAKVIINRDSTGISFAVINKIPILFIYTNELSQKKNTFLKRQKYFANQLGIEPINIDALQDEHKINNSFYCDYEKYESYKRKYLTSRDDQLKNFDLIKKIILNLQ